MTGHNAPPRSAQRWGWAFVVAATSLNCRDTARPAAAPLHPPTAVPDTAPPEEPGTPDRRLCPAAHEPLGDLSFVPRRARMLLRLDLRHPELDASLAALRTFAREEHQPPLPIAATQVLAHLDLELGFLRSALASSGFAPAELLRLSGDVETAWAFRSRCDTDIAVRAVEGAFGVLARRTVDAIVTTPPRESAFPYEVIFLPQDLVVLAPRGHSTSVRAWLSPSMGASQDSDLEPSPSARLTELPSAPIQGVLVGRFLVDGANAPNTPNTQAEPVPTVWTLRIGPQGVDLGSVILRP